MNVRVTLFGVLVVLMVGTAIAAMATDRANYAASAALYAFCATMVAIWIERR